MRLSGFGIIVAFFTFSASLLAREPAPKAASASDYTIAEDSLSPNGRYAIAYLKETPEDWRKVKNYVVEVKPFRIIAEVHGSGVRADSKRMDVEVEWTADNSAVIATTRHDKWDMIVGSSYVALRDGKAARRIDLLAGINRQLDADFRKSKGEVFNDYLPVILTNSLITFEEGGKVIRVKTDAMNDPNTARNVSWHAEFEGVLNIANEKWKVVTLKSTATKN